jgi:hypothetical protein
LRRADKLRVLVAAGLVGAFMSLKLVYCKRDPNKPVPYNTCKIADGVCFCESSDLKTDQGTCGTFECCARFERRSHAHVQSVCSCNHSDPKTHACPNVSPNTERVESCP